MSYSCAKFYKDDDCSDWWDVKKLSDASYFHYSQEIPNWQHVVIVCMWIAMAAEAIALVWNLLTL